MDGLGRTISVFSQTQQTPSDTRTEWAPSAVMDLQIYHLCRTLHFLIVRVGEPVFAHAIRDDSSVRRHAMHLCFRPLPAGSQRSIDAALYARTCLCQACQLRAGAFNG